VDVDGWSLKEVRRKKGGLFNFISLAPKKD
jgi:hypothetical protein